jgi:hypothetical protein
VAYISGTPARSPKTLERMTKKLEPIAKKLEHHPEEPPLRSGTSGLHDGSLSGLKKGCSID